MKKHICFTAATLLGLAIGFSANAAFFEEPQGYSNITLKGLKTVTLNIDLPRGTDYSAISTYGVTSEKLRELISTRLRDAGFKVINYSESLADPEAALLDLRVRVDMPWGSFYAFDVKLSVNQKVTQAQGASSFYSVRTWSDRQIGALQAIGPGLYPLYSYSLQLVDNFIKTHQSQN